MRNTIERGREALDHGSNPMFVPLDYGIEDRRTEGQMSRSVIDDHGRYALAPGEPKTFQGMTVEPCVHHNIVGRLGHQVVNQLSIGPVLARERIAAAHQIKAREPDDVSTVGKTLSLRKIEHVRRYDENAMALEHERLGQVVGIDLCTSDIRIVQGREYAYGLAQDNTPTKSDPTGRLR